MRHTSGDRPHLGHKGTQVKKHARTQAHILKEPKPMDSICKKADDDDDDAMGPFCVNNYVDNKKKKQKRDKKVRWQSGKAIEGEGERWVGGFRGLLDDGNGISRFL